MDKHKILIQLDTDPHPSVFDRIVAVDAGADEIKRAHRQLTRRYHPDITGDDTSVAVGGVLADEVHLDFPSVLSVLDRMRQILGVEPTVSLKDGVARVCAHVRERLQRAGGAAT